MPFKIAIFASGGGSNAEQIILNFQENSKIEVSLILTNNKNAYVLERAQKHNIPAVTFTRNDLYQTEKVLNLLKENGIDFIVLAGFLLLVPQNLIRAYSDRIVNIHPALLPAYGGKGMYGHHVHQAVFDNFEKESGITIHMVNQKYDEGRQLFQKSVPLNVTDTPDIIASKVLELEHEYFPLVIEDEIKKILGD
ncbi:MAG: phosphoribosylglycinamide formyltransferase [Saprospiraceae bacterium]|nr:phosphoribosylglycinamide formyltransferase [Saprospiraceae bacterium]